MCLQMHLVIRLSQNVGAVIQQPNTRPKDTTVKNEPVTGPLELGLFVAELGGNGPGVHVGTGL